MRVGDDQFPTFAGFMDVGGISVTTNFQLLMPSPKSKSAKIPKSLYRLGEEGAVEYQ